MKKFIIVFGIICAIFIAIIAVNPPTVTFEETVAEAPVKPKSVPKDAFWVGGIDGGNFILVNKRSSETDSYTAYIYNDFSGDLEFEGVLKYSGNKPMEMPLTDPASYFGWDGEKLYLSNGGYMAADEREALTKSSSGR
jgi:hypothetical protein